MPPNSYGQTWIHVTNIFINDMRTVSSRTIGFKQSLIRSDHAAILVTSTCDKHSRNPAPPPCKLLGVTLMATAVPTTTPSIADRLRALETVGNTPLLAIDYEVGGRKRTIYAKSEQMNLTGSIKDRMALHIIRKAYAEGRLHPGDTIAEATSGNTGIAFAAVGRTHGHPVTIFMPNSMSRERMDLIHSLGANIIPVTKQQGGFLGSIRMWKIWRWSAKTSSCRASSPTPPTSEPTPRPQAPNSTCSSSPKA
jgi:hypothetical protein